MQTAAALVVEAHQALIRQINRITGHDIGLNISDGTILTILRLTLQTARELHQDHKEANVAPDLHHNPP
jgi:hypothetical protein